MHTLAQLVLGLVLGWILSRTRPAPGGEVVDWTGLDPKQAAMWSAFGLFLYAVILRGRVRGPRLFALWCVPVGAFLHAFVGPASFEIPPYFVFLLMPLVAVAALVPDTRIDDQLPKPRWIELAGLALAAAAATTALGCVWRHLPMLSDGTSGATSAHMVVLFLLLALGASAFAPVWRSLRAARLASGTLLCASSVACLASLALLDSLATQRGLGEHMRRFALDSSWLGTWRWDAAVAGGVLALPGLLAGAALHALRGRGALAAVLFGAGAGLLLLPSLVEGSDVARERLALAQWIPLCAFAATAGAALAALAESKDKLRWVAAGASLALGALAAIPTVEAVVILSPWSRRPIIPHMAVESAAGFATVEPGQGGIKLATLDRRRLTPDLEDAGDDLRRLAASASFVPASARAGGLDVLFVGQLTALRANALLQAGATRIDRTAAWHDAMASMEAALFDGAGGMAPPAGEVLEPDKALARYRSGEYELVVCAAVAGELRLVSEIEPPSNTTVVRWLDGDAPLPRSIPAGRWAGVEQQVLVAHGRGLEAVQWAVVANGEPASEPAPTVLAAGDGPFEDAGREGEWSRRFDRPILRGKLDRARNWEALAAAQSGSAAQLLCQAGARFAHDQGASSPFETEAQQVELEDGVLELLGRLGVQGRLDDYSRACVEGAARVLAQKRDIDRLLRYAEPIAAAGSWPRLEVELARAELEMLEAAAASARLARVGDALPADRPTHMLRAEVLEAVNDFAGAVAQWRAALALAPTDHGLQRSLAAALVQGGDPSGRAMVEDLLKAHPEDEALRAFLGPGPHGRLVPSECEH
ncbi:MAG: tetratricopeptide repeat protein [Planctomycetia bacterium]